MADLSGPRSKIKRAKKHIDEFESIIGGLVFSHSEQPHVIGIEHDPETGNEVYKPLLIPDVPCDVAPVAADAIHNLRAAFDLLMGQLIERAAHKPPGKGTPGFRYGETAEGFEAACTPKIKTLIGKDAFDCVRATEAYPGGKGEAIWYLHHLDVEDKHRVVYNLGFNFGAMTLPHYTSDIFSDEVNATFAQMMGGIFWNPADTLFPLKAGEPLYVGPPKPHSDPKFRFDVAFSEPQIVHAQPVLPTLTGFLQTTEALLDSFAALF